MATGSGQTFAAITEAYRLIKFADARRVLFLVDRTTLGRQAPPGGGARPDQGTVLEAFRDRLFTEIFPDRRDVPKTLIFAKDDSHADDIVQIVREVFGKGNDFAQKITYKTWLTGQRPEDLIASFRKSYFPRIAVTRRHDGHRHRRPSDRDHHVHARGEGPELLRADEGARCARDRPERASVLLERIRKEMLAERT